MTHPKTFDTPLGKQVSYTAVYDPGQLVPIPRQAGRETAGIKNPDGLWHGEDIWNIYELSWLSPSGRPEVAIAELRVPADSPFLIESKSLKLYCNSFNMTSFHNGGAVRETIIRDVSRAAGTEVEVSLIEADHFGRMTLAEPHGICLDDQEIDNFTYTIAPSLLSTGQREMRQTLFTRLFRSCCPVTGQPDWATVIISYDGRQIAADNLLRYLISYREHTGFHEACVEKIFSDIVRYCKPAELTVYARFTRRGGIDINPVRSTKSAKWPNIRDPRQ